MAISTPAKTQINVVATTFDHSAKSNLGQIRTGSYLSQASMLVYDDILRFQRSSDGYMSDSDINNFNYNQFEGNILWFMDELVGMESDWIQDASPGIKDNTAYGYVQFTEDSVETAVNRYIGHLERFNKRSADRGWEPYSIKKDETLPIPEWLTILKNSTKTHEEKLDALTYDEMLALAFVHLHSKKSKDSNFVLLSEGDIDASKELYKNNHHTNPDAATLTRLESFFPHRKQNKYTEKLAHATSIVPKEDWMHKHCPGDASSDKTADDVINCIDSKLQLHEGVDLFNDYKNNAVASNSTVTDVTSSVANLGVYTNFHASLATGRALHPANSTYKAFVRQYTDNTTTPPTLMYSYYFYRTGNITGEWLNGIKAELIRDPTLYNYDELCQTITSWPTSVNTYIVDWMYIDTPNANYLSPTTPYTHGILQGFSWKGSPMGGILVLATSWQDARGWLSTMFHEGGGHAMHNLWGGKPGEFLDATQNTALNTLYKNYKTLHTGPNNDYTVGTFANLYPAGLAVGNLAILNAQQAWLQEYFTHLPMNNITSLASPSYNDSNIEDEFLARVYSMMAVNKCITFTDDIWPVMKSTTPGLSGIINIDMARKIDTEMRDKMLLDMRTYDLGSPIAWHS